MVDSTWRAARDLVLRYGWSATAYQILNHGMVLWSPSSGEAVVGYVLFRGVRVVAGTPVCATERLADVTAGFEADAARCGERVLFFGAGARLERALAPHTRRSVVRLGAQPVWEPHVWAGIVDQKMSLRAQLHRATNKGVRVAEWPESRARNNPLLEAVLKEWLDSRGLPPLGFLVTPDLLDNLADRRVFVAERDGAAAGFLIATPIPARNGWLVEQWPRLPSAPNGTTHLLVDAAMRAFAASGSRYASLGLAPLSDQAGEIGEGHPAWLRFLLHQVRAYGRRFYNFRGLEAFKSGMQPMAWEPIYAIAQGRRFTPSMLRAVAGAFSAGAPERLAARALVSAAGRTARAMPGRVRAVFTPPARDSSRVRRGP
jgi:phosphatidylglycerol lysyltransferase